MCTLQWTLIKVLRLFDCDVRKSCELIQSAAFTIIILKHERENKTHTKVKWNIYWSRSWVFVNSTYIRCSWQQNNNVKSGWCYCCCSSSHCHRRQRCWFRLNVNRQTTKAHYTGSSVISTNEKWCLFWMLRQSDAESFGNAWCHTHFTIVFFLPRFSRLTLFWNLIYGNSLLYVFFFFPFFVQKFYCRVNNTFSRISMSSFVFDTYHICQTTANTHVYFKTKTWHDNEMEKKSIPILWISECKVADIVTKPKSLKLHSCGTHSHTHTNTYRALFHYINGRTRARLRYIIQCAQRTL